VEEVLTTVPREFNQPRLSPDGTRVAVEIGTQIWTYDLARDSLTRLTLEGAQNDSPVWAPDARRIAFRSNREGPPRIFWQLADGSGGQERLTDVPGVPQDFSRDGQVLAYQAITARTQRDISVLSLQDRKVETVISTPGSDVAPRFSPDRRWLAYVSDESGRPEVYVRPFGGSDGKWQISTDGGTEPVWSRDGRELFYRVGLTLMAVPVDTAPNFTAGKPAVLFEGNYVASDFPLTSAGYDVSSDGQRFLMVRDVEPLAATAEIKVVVNWSEELKRRVPANQSR
jgi:serine/threonine-protein kinase